MRAIQITETGGPEVLRLAELPDPQPGPGELLIEVAAAGVNYIDTYHRSGAYSRQLPFVLGTEGAGEVFDAVRGGSLRISIGGRYPLTEAHRAHEDLQGRRTTGKLLLLPH